MASMCVVSSTLGPGARRQWPLPPRVAPAGGDTQHSAQGGHVVDGLVGGHELESLDGIALVSRANQAAAFERIARSSRSCRFSRRSRRSSSCSSVVRPSVRWPASSAACFTQFRIAWAEGSNCRPSSSGVRPFRTNSTSRARNSGGYGRLLFGVVDAPFRPNSGLSTKPGPLQTATTMPEWATTVTLYAAALPFFTRLSIPCRRAMSTSADSPSWARFTVAPPVANEIASLCPVARSNFGPRSSMTDCIPKALSTLSSAASALIPSTSRNMSPILAAATIERIFIASSCEMVNLRHAPTAPGHSFVALVKAPRTLSSALGGWIVDDTFGLVYSESSFRGVEYDEHVVPGVGYDGAEA